MVETSELMVETAQMSPSDETLLKRLRRDILDMQETLARSHATIGQTAALLQLADKMEDPLISTEQMWGSLDPT
jgi:hypothetical protein